MLCYHLAALPAHIKIVRLFVCLSFHRTNNPVILQLLLSLIGSITNPLMQELTTRTISACPDLLLSYLRSLSFSLEPRASSRWMTNINFLIKVR